MVYAHILNNKNFKIKRIFKYYKTRKDYEYFY